MTKGTNGDGEDHLTTLVTTKSNNLQSSLVAHTKILKEALIKIDTKYLDRLYN